MELTVMLKGDEEGFAVWCPGLPGCASQGATEAEALENIEDAIREYLIVQEQIAGREVGVKVATIKVERRVA